MADNVKETPRWREWLSEKLNPIQPTIASMNPYVVPETIVEFEQAYREIEIIHRAIDMVINATSLGLNEKDEINLSFPKASGSKLFYDIIYNPKETNFLKQGKKS